MLIESGIKLADMNDATFKHKWYEDLFGLAIGSILIAIGIEFMQVSGLLTGGTVGVSQLIARNTNLSLSLIYGLVSFPFFILAIWKKGLNFATRSFISVIVVSYLVDFFPRFMDISISNQFAGTVVANTLAGMGVLAVFRHNSSLGGFAVVGLIAQEKLKIQAGVVLAAIDLAVLATGYNIYGRTSMINSVIGVVIFNGILALNHRPDRYVGTSA